MEQTWETAATGGIERKVAPAGEGNTWFRKSAGEM